MEMRWSVPPAAAAGVALFLLLPGCSAPASGGGGGGPAPEPGMQPHFFRAGLVHDAVVHGSLERAREPAGWLAQQPIPPDLPPESETFVAELQSAAAAVRDAATLDEAGLATARMAGACGACHRRFDGGPEVMPLPSQDGMLAHLWAAERLWQGLIAPSDESWMAGARLMETVSFTGSAEPPPGIADLVRAAHESGSAARTAERQSERAEVYGSLLETCAECHRRVGVTGRQ